MIARSTLVLLLPLLFIASCSTSYTPLRSSRIQLVLRNGNPAYLRDGHTIGHGWFGGGLVRAVQGVPAAEEAARTHRSRVIIGFTTLLLSVGCSTIAATYVQDEPDIAGTAMLACLGASVGSVWILASGAPYQLDAINIFNDSVPDGPVSLP